MFHVEHLGVFTQFIGGVEAGAAGCYVRRGLNAQRLHCEVCQGECCRGTVDPLCNRGSRVYRPIHRATGCRTRYRLPCEWICAAEDSAPSSEQGVFGGRRGLLDGAWALSPFLSWPNSQEGVRLLRRRQLLLVLVEVSDDRSPIFAKCAARPVPEGMECGRICNMASLYRRPRGMASVNSPQISALSRIFRIDTPWPQVVSMPRL